MAKQKAKGLDASYLEQPKPATERVEQKPVAMTLKLPYADYVRLKNVAIQQRRKAQSVMADAVREYLDRQ
jgi:hypothetical protein